MGFSCIAAVVLLLETPSASTQPQPLVGHEVNVAEMKGLAWRGALYSHLTPVARSRGATIWTAPRSSVSKILGESARVVYTPKPSTGRDVPADIRTTLCYPYVAHLERHADGPFGKATAVGYLPHIDQVEESLNVGVRCRLAKGSVQAEVSIEETRLAMLTNYDIGEVVQPTQPGTGAESTTIKAPIQVPEIIHGEVHGQWSIPDGHVLVIGLGIHTTQDKQGKSSILERVAIIDPKPDQIAAPANDPVAPPAEIPVAQTPQFPSAILAPHDPNTQTVSLPATALPPLPIAESGRWAGHAIVQAASAAAAPSIPAPPAYTMPASLSSSAPLVVSSPNGGPLVVIVPVSGPLNVAAAGAATAVPAHILPPQPVAPIAMNIPAEPLGTPIIPERTLPTPRNARGQVVPLPPLPEPAPEIADPTGATRGSSQDRHIRSVPPEPTDDTTPTTPAESSDHQAALTPLQSARSKSAR